MLDLWNGINTTISFINNIKEAKNQNELMRHAIIAEAKFNNDLADLICRSNAKKIALTTPKLFSKFSTVTSEVLIAIGKPAHVIIGDDKAPLNQDIIELDKSSTPKSLFEKKNPSELYEFYIRKCRLLKALTDGNGLTTTRVSLQQRCKNIRLATTILIRKC